MKFPKASVIFLDTETMGVSGTWYNELGSMMTLVQAADGTLTGTYKSKVGKPGGVHPLHGFVDAGFPTTLGFTVTYTSVSSIISSDILWYQSLFLI